MGHTDSACGEVSVFCPWDAVVAKRTTSSVGSLPQTSGGLDHNSDCYFMKGWICLWLLAKPLLVELLSMREYLAERVEQQLGDCSSQT